MSDSGSLVSDILNQLGWDSGLSIPIANESNKRLTVEIERKQKETIHRKSELEYFEEKTQAVEDHLRNVRLEHQRVQDMLQAKQRATESEEHMAKICQREEGRLKQELIRLDEMTTEVKQRINMHENTIFKQTSALEEMKVQMNWDQQALEAWLEESEKKSEDSLAIQKYKRQDEGKIRELSLQLERLTQEANEKKRKLDEEVVDTQTTQVELDKIAEEFRAAHTERQGLIHQWELTIQQMQKRDGEIDSCAAQLARVKMTVREKEEVIREKEKFLEDAKSGNYEAEKKVDLAERTAAKLRLDYQNAETQREQFQSELEALARTVDRTNTDLEGTRTQVTQLKNEVKEKMVKLNSAKETRQELQQKLTVVTDSKLSAEEQAAQMDQLLVEEEQRQKEMESELKRLREIQFRKAQELNDARIEVKNTEASIMGSRAALRNLNSKIGKLDHDMLKRQEILYNQDFQIQQLERRINRMTGDHSNEEKVHLEARIKDLNDELDERNATHATLTTQLKNLQDDIRRVKSQMELTRAEKDDWTVKIDELNLHNDNSLRELNKIESERQALLVEDHLKKLTIKNLRTILNTKADEVMSQEKRKLQLDTAMNERRQEISIHREMLETQIRQADNERQQASSELHERQAKIDKLQKRYEILMVTMAPPEGEEEKSQAYYVIKAAQDKEELQRKGDTLDAEIRKQEKEKRGLENALRVINSNNEHYRKGFTKVSDSSDEMADKQKLEEQMRVAMDKYKYKRRQLRELEEDIEAMRQSLGNLSKDVSLVDSMQQEKMSELAQLEKVRAEHLQKVERAEKAVIRAQRELRSAGGGAVSEETDIQAREAREYNRQTVKELLSAAEKLPEAADMATQYLSQADIPLPSSAPGSVASSRLSSARSSNASNRSAASTARSGASSSRPAPGKVVIGGDLPAPGSSRSSTSSTKSSARSGARRY